MVFFLHFCKKLNYFFLHFEDAPNKPTQTKIKMPTGKRSATAAGGILARKQYKLNEHMRTRVPDNQPDDTWTDFARINLYDKHENGLTAGEVRNFIKRLGKAKRGGILKFEVLVHKKFIKYFPKNIPMEVSPNGGNIYPDDAWYVKTYGNEDTRKDGRMMLDCGPKAERGDGKHRIVQFSIRRNDALYDPVSQKYYGRRFSRFGDEEWEAHPRATCGI